MSIFMFYMLLFYVIVCYNKHWRGAYESTYNKIQKCRILLYCKILYQIFLQLFFDKNAFSL